jgi:soluble cytochrome b562
MRKTFIFMALQLALLGGVMCATFEIRDDDMRDIEDTLKSLDSNVALQDRKAAAEARELQAYFQQVEQFYATQPGKADAVGFSRKTHELAARVRTAAEAGNFDAAGDAVGQLTRSCKTCHDVHKER